MPPQHAQDLPNNPVREKRIMHGSLFSSFRLLVKGQADQKGTRQLCEIQHHHFDGVLTRTRQVPPPSTQRT
jgi:hypothetical protein